MYVIPFFLAAAGATRAAKDASHDWKPALRLPMWRSRRRFCLFPARQLLGYRRYGSARIVIKE
jgi:hypothetical protein